MGSVNAPFGLRVTGRLDNGSLEVFRQYPIASGLAVNIAAGDIVNLVDNGTSTTITKQTGTGDTSTDIWLLVHRPLDWPDHVLEHVADRDRCIGRSGVRR
jgi:hypothetical protein